MSDNAIIDGFKQYLEAVKQADAVEASACDALLLAIQAEQKKGRTVSQMQSGLSGLKFRALNRHGEHAEYSARAFLPFLAVIASRMREVKDLPILDLVRIARQASADGMPIAEFRGIMGRGKVTDIMAGLRSKAESSRKAKAAERAMTLDPDSISEIVRALVTLGRVMRGGNNQVHTPEAQELFDLLSGALAPDTNPLLSEELLINATKVAKANRKAYRASLVDAQ